MILSVQKLTAIIFGGIFILSGQAARADDAKIYVEAAFIPIYYNEPLLAFNHSMVGVRVGYNIDKNFSVEAMGATNINSASGWVGSAYVTAQVATANGFFVKFKTDNPQGFNVYGKIGTASGTVTASSAYGSVWTSNNYSMSYGGGIQYDANDKFYYTVDFMSYYNNNLVTVRGASTSVGYRF